MSWLAGYGYRKAITINGSIDGAQANYQMMLAIVKGSHLSWPYDVRFTKSDGVTLLDFWREEYDATDGTWWVEFDTIPIAPGTATFYMYYGKVSDTDASSGVTVFPFFDHFDSDLSKWIECQAMSSSGCSLGGTDYDGILAWDGYYGTSFTLRTDKVNDIDCGLYTDGGINYTIWYLHGEKVGVDAWMGALGFAEVATALSVFTCAGGVYTYAGLPVGWTIIGVDPPTITPVFTIASSILSLVEPAVGGGYYINSKTTAGPTTAIRVRANISSAAANSLVGLRNGGATGTDVDPMTGLLNGYGIGAKVIENQDGVFYNANFSNYTLDAYKTWDGVVKPAVNTRWWENGVELLNSPNAVRVPNSANLRATLESNAVPGVTCLLCDWVLRRKYTANEPTWGAWGALEIPAQPSDPLPISLELPDSNAIIRAYLLTQPVLCALVSASPPRIFCPRLPVGTTLPAISFFTRGGNSTPYIPDIPEPSVQFDCWALTAIAARDVYRKLYDALQGIQNVAVVVGGVTYYIESAIEEVQGQDLVDQEIPNYFHTLTFFSIVIKI